jgi:hypothetical protein
MPLREVTPVVPGPFVLPDRRGALRAGALEALSAAGVTLLPKCPMCLMAYASVFGGLGVERLPLDDAWPVAVGLLAVSLALTGYRAWRRARLRRFTVAVLGAGVLVAGRWADAPPEVAGLGLALLAAGLGWTRWGLGRRLGAVRS